MRAACILPAIAFTTCAGDPLKSELLFHASFDHGADADFATGERCIFTAPDRKRAQPRPGIAEADGVEIEKGGGRFGDALAFRRKSRDLVFYQGEGNLGHQLRNWSGAASFWMRLDPDRDLEPGYCDPLQFVAQAWGEGNMFVEFSKDHTPRHFRYAIMAVTRLWNPGNEKWEEMARRPMVAVERPPFSRARWTHVCVLLVMPTPGPRTAGAASTWTVRAWASSPAGKTPSTGTSRRPP